MGAVEYVHASAFGVDHAGFLQLSEVVADRRFGQSDGGRQVAGADFAGVVGEQD